MRSDILAGMFGKKHDADVFSLGQTSPGLAAPPSPVVPMPPEQLLYAENWKEFDKLRKAVKSHGAPQLVRTFFDLVLFGSGLFGLHHYAKKYTLLVLMIWGALAVVGLLRWPNLKNRFLHWPCPRCHSEWPGTKTEKDPACKVCGLRLHQMSP